MKRTTTGVQLPFLKNKTWPRVAKPAGESRYGFTEDDDLIESSLEELMRAHAAKDGRQFMDALEALIHIIQEKEGAHGDASESA